MSLGYSTTLTLWTVVHREWRSHVYPRSHALGQFVVMRHNGLWWNAPLRGGLSQYHAPEFLKNSKIENSTNTPRNKMLKVKKIIEFPWITAFIRRKMRSFFFNINIQFLTWWRQLFLQKLNSKSISLHYTIIKISRRKGLVCFFDGVNFSFACPYLVM